MASASPWCNTCAFFVGTSVTGAARRCPACQPDTYSPGEREMGSRPPLTRSSTVQTAVSAELERSHSGLLAGLVVVVVVAILGYGFSTVLGEVADIGRPAQTTSHSCSRQAVDRGLVGGDLNSFMFHCLDR